MKFSDLNDLPSTLDVNQVADVWGCSTWTIYAMVKAGNCPVAPLHLGRCLRWPTVAVLRSIGVDDPGPAQTGPGGNAICTTTPNEGGGRCDRT